jgi:hypothetical protein
MRESMIIKNVQKLNKRASTYLRATIPWRNRIDVYGEKQRIHIEGLKSHREAARPSHHRQFKLQSQKRNNLGSIRTKWRWENNAS